MLCSEINPSDLRFVMREWEKAESPIVYWYKKLRDHDQKGKLHKISMEDHITYDNHESDFSLYNYVPLVHGLPVPEALMKCRELYKNNIAQVTIQISEDSVLMTRRDYSITFAEQLSIISMYHKDEPKHL